MILQCYRFNPSEQRGHGWTGLMRLVLCVLQMLGKAKSVVFSQAVSLLFAELHLLHQEIIICGEMTSFICKLTFSFGQLLVKVDKHLTAEWPFDRH